MITCDVIYINVTEKYYKAFKTKFCYINNMDNRIYMNLQYEQENEFSFWECKRKLGNEDGKSSFCTTYTQISIYLSLFFLKNRDRCTLSKGFLIVFITPWTTENTSVSSCSQKTLMVHKERPLRFNPNFLYLSMSFIYFERFSLSRDLKCNRFTKL